MPVNRRERNRRDKLLRIRQAAAMLFKKHGFEGTTTQAVAEAADIGNGTLFLYAPTKDDLLDIVMASDLIELIVESLGRVDEANDLAEQAWHLFAPLLDYHARDPALSKWYVLSLRRMPHQAITRSPAMAIINALTDLVRRKQVRKHVRQDREAGHLAMSLFSLYYGHLTLWLFGMLAFPQCTSQLRVALRSHLEGIQND